MAANGNANPSQSRPLCAAFDADSGGDVANIPALVAVLNTQDVTMIIIEDKALSEPGTKVNSLLQKSGSQDQADMHEFADIIRAFKFASTHRDMMVTARIETFTVRSVQEDAAQEKASIQAALHEALTRAEVYTNAGADTIVIHSKSAQPDEVLAFLNAFRARDAVTPLVVVPTAYSHTARTELADAGANVIIYANYLMRATISAMSDVSIELLAEDPALFAHDEELKVCLETRNYDCLLRKLLERKYSGDTEDEATSRYLIVAEKRAKANMGAAVRKLASGEKSGCEADGLIVPVKQLLKINASQVASI